MEAGLRRAYTFCALKYHLLTNTVYSEFLLVFSVLRYDFEMYYIDNPEVASEIVSASGAPTQGHARLNKIVALFRDQKTVDALTTAPPIVRLFLEEAGFGMKAAREKPCEKQTGVYDPVMRRTLIGQLSAALENRAMKKALSRAANDSAFNIHDLIAEVVGKDPKAVSKNRTHPAQGIATPTVKPRRPRHITPPSVRRRVRPV